MHMYKKHPTLTYTTIDSLSLSDNGRWWYDAQIMVDNMLNLCPPKAVKSMQNLILSAKLSPRL